MTTLISLPSLEHSTCDVNTRALIYFICGNPGYVEYYRDFFNYLRHTIDSSGERTVTAYDIYGRNLLGFGDENREPFSQTNPPFEVEAEVDGIYDDLVAMRRVDAPTKPYDSIIIMGHSVGAYICMEIFHRHMKDPSRAPHLNLRHGFLLFPTLTDLALSPNGLQLGFLGKLPLFENHAHTAAKLGLSLLPLSVLYWIVNSIMGFSPQTAKLTVEFLTSKDGIWQALYLGKSELKTITDEKWEEEVWEVTKDKEESYQDGPKFYFYYGKKDEWVANEVRDKFIETRRKHGERGGRTHIEVDDGSLKHAFCTKQGQFYSYVNRELFASFAITDMLIDQSLIVAQRVVSWIEQIDAKNWEAHTTKHQGEAVSHSPKKPKE